MTTLYTLRALESDLSGDTAEWNRTLIEGTQGLGTETLAAHHSAPRNHYAFTEAGVPGDEGVAGDYSVPIFVEVGDTTSQVRVRLARVNASGVVQSESGFSANQTLAGGLQTHSFNSLDLGTWASTDRLRIHYEVSRTSGMGSSSATVRTGDDTGVVAPWTIESGEELSVAGTLPALVGSFETDASSDASLEGMLPELVGSFQAEADVDIPILTIDGTDLLWDGVKLNSGTVSEGMPINTRMVQATVDFSDEANTSNWDADANTAAFIAELPSYRERGVDLITFSFQGGNFEAGWGESYDAGAFNPDGSIRSAHASRITDVIDAMIANDIIPMVGLFYFRQDQILTDEAAVLNAVANAKTLLDPYKDQIIVEVANEADASLYDHDILKTARISELIDSFVADGFFATTSWSGNIVPTASDMGDAQVIVLHFNGRTIAQMEDQIATAKSRFPNMPIFCNEDNATGGSPPTFHTAAHSTQRLITCLDNGIGWGFFDRQTGGWQYWSGVNEATIDWSFDDNEVRLGVMNAFRLFSDRSSTVFTTLTEDWEHPDSPLINGDLDWATIVGELNIESGAAITQTRLSRNQAVANLPLASEDMRVIGTVIPFDDNRGAGVIARASHSVETYYYAQIHEDLNLLRLQRLVNGTTTNLVTEKAYTVNPDQTYKVELIVTTEGGSARVIMKVDDVEEFNTLDSSPITGNHRAGFRDFRGTDTLVHGGASFDELIATTNLEETVEITGELPALEGSFDAEASADVELAGTLPFLEGSLSLEALASVEVAGSLPALEGSIELEAAAVDVELAGELPSLSGALQLEASAEAQLAGQFPELEGSFVAEPSADISLAGSLPVLEGSIVLEADTVALELTGALPSLEGTFDAEASADASLDGSLPELLGTFETEASADVSVAGSLPAIDGSFSLETDDVTARLAGSLPAIVGSVELEASAEASLTGELPAIEGSLTLEAEDATVQLDGELPVLEGSFEAETGSLVTLDGNLPPLEGELNVVPRADIEIVGELPVLEGSVDLESSASASLAGSLPSLEASFETETSVQATVNGELPELEGSVSLEVTGGVALAGSLPAIEGSFDLEMSTVLLSVAAELPSLEASLNFSIDIEYFIRPKFVSSSTKLSRGEFATQGTKWSRGEFET